MDQMNLVGISRNPLKSVKSFLNQNAAKTPSWGMQWIPVLCFLLPAQVHAQQFSFSVSPHLVEMIIKPGKSVVIAYTITNGGDPTIISANVLPFQPHGISGDVELKRYGGT